MAQEGQPDWLISAKSWAEVQNISVGQAIKQIRAQEKAVKLAEKLGQTDSDYAGSVFQRVKGAQKLILKYKRGSAKKLSALTNDPDLVAESSVEEAAFSLNDLVNAQEAFIAAAKNSGSAQFSVGIRQDINRVGIYSDNLDEVRTLISAANLDFAKFELINEKLVSGTEAAISGGEKLKGTVVLQTAAGQSYISLCQTGFNVTNYSGKKGVSTAGHCGQDVLIIDGTSTSIGNVQASSSTTGVDVRWHADPAHTYTNKVKFGGQIVSVTSAVGRSLMTPGNTQICLGKRNQTARCTTVLETNFMEPLPTGGTRGPFVRMTTHVGEGGDSGGPWMSGGAAFGIHRGYVTSFNGASYSTFTAIENLSAINVYALTSP